MEEYLEVKAYRRLAAAIIVRAATDFAQSENEKEVCDAAMFFVTKWFAFLAEYFEMNALEFVVELTKRRAEFRCEQMERVDFRGWLKQQ